MKIGVVRFPGTNCDYDIFQFVQDSGFEAQWLWHQDRFNIKDYERIIIPGGFSFGDYLRCGALAARSPVMDSLREFANSGRGVLGICNGFQILCESGLLPGVLRRNKNQRFIDDWVDLKKQNSNPFFAVKSADSIRLPIAHGEGCFYIDADGLKQIQDNQQIWFTYEKTNPNGSVQDIAGVMSKNKNVMALMPHPERAFANWMGSVDGSLFL